MLGKISNKPVRRAIGLMSGTSVDGIDAALVEISGRSKDIKVSLCEFENKPFPVNIKNKIVDLFSIENTTVDKTGYMNVLLGELYAEAVFSLVKKAGLKMSDIDFVGSHGQTIYHHPQISSEDGYPISYSVQIGEGAVIANRTNIPCVSDFRVADLAVGGQGAPLVPFTEFLLYKSTKETVLLQNIGGIGNITVLAKDCEMEDVYAFDTGPGNMIMDGLVSLYTKGEKTIDIDGEIAAKGVVNQSLLKALCGHDYFTLKPPKSTGREMFGKDYIINLYNKLQKMDITMESAIATVTDFTAWAIADSYEKYILPNNQADRLVIGGGGSYNPVLVSMIRQRMKPYGVEVNIQEEIGFSSDAKEAVAFALLADCAIAGRCNNIPAVTGASRPVVLGKISI